MIISNIMVSPDVRDFLDENLIKHMTINSLVSLKKRFGKEYGEIVICCDSRDGYWRKEFFPHYKACRKKDREENSFVDWKEIFRVKAILLEDLETYFPYKVLHVSRAEADDIIGHLALTADSPVLIVGSDKDYYQCQTNTMVKQWSTRLKDFVVCTTPKSALVEKIVKGDKGDGIPNIKSPEDCFVTGARQKSVYKDDLKEIEESIFFHGKYMTEDSEKQRRFDLNKKLVDFTEIPPDIKLQILEAFHDTIPKGNKETVMDYFMKNRMRNLIQDIQYI